MAIRVNWLHQKWFASANYKANAASILFLECKGLGDYGMLAFPLCLELFRIWQGHYCFQNNWYTVIYMMSFLCACVRVVIDFLV